MPICRFFVEYWARYRVARELESETSLRIRELGTKSDIHENVISPGVIVPWHFHETEEVIVVLEGNGECRTETGTETYAGGDIIILPPRVKHSLKNSGDTLIRQICIFPDDPRTTFLEDDYPGQTVDMFNPSEWTKPSNGGPPQSA